MRSRPERHQKGLPTSRTISRRGPSRQSAPWTSTVCALALLLLGAVAGLPGCTRAFFRERADIDVDRLLVEKEADDRWRLLNYYIYPHPYARFADLTGQIDKPPMPPDDPSAWVLSPKPQKPKAVFNSEGVGYLEMLAAFDTANRAALKKVSTASDAQPPAKAPQPLQPPQPGKPALSTDATAKPTPPPGTPDKQPTAESKPAVAAGDKTVTVDTGGCPAVIAFGVNRFGREEPFLITMDQSLELAVINSREFQDRREQLYLTALPVTLQRFNFMPQFLATSDFFRRWSASESPFGKQDDLRVDTAVGLTQTFETGAMLVLRLANQTTIDFVNNGRPTLSQSTKFLELSQPFLRGGGRAVTLEPLTQAERNLLYDVRDFAHFNREFFVAVVTGRVSSTGGFGLGGRNGYLQSLLTAAFLENARRNERDFLILFQRYQAFVAGGIQSQLQLDQIEQNYLNARLNVISNEVLLKNNLDNFKLILGVPPDLPLELDDTPLEPIKKQIDRFEHLISDYRQVIQELEGLRDKPGLTRSIRPDILRLFTQLPLTKGSLFAAGLQRSWPEWQRLSQQELTTRLNTFRREREQIRLEDERAKDRNETLPAERQLRLRVVEANIQLGSMEETVREYEREPWKALQQPDSERQRRELFRSVVFRFTLLLETVRFERLTQIQKSWPDLPAVQLHGLDLMGLPEEEAQNLVAQTALINRLDLMNQRARVVDAWRQIAVQANSLLGTFDVRYNLDVLTPPPQVAQPLNFDGNRARHQIIVNTELPLVRRLERNNYRAALIAFQRSRRNLQESEDIVVQQLRLTVRQLRQLQENFKIQQRALQLSYSQMDQALEAQFAPADPRRVSADAGSAAALTDQVIRAQQNIPRAQNDLFRSWVDYLSSRMELYRDLELMQIDNRGVWINDFARPTTQRLEGPQPGNAPGSQGVPGGAATAPGS